MSNKVKRVSATYGPGLEGAENENGCVYVKCCFQFFKIVIRGTACKTIESCYNGSVILRGCVKRSESSRYTLVICLSRSQSFDFVSRLSSVLCIHTKESAHVVLCSCSVGDLDEFVVLRAENGDGLAWCDVEPLSDLIENVQCTRCCVSYVF